MRAYEILSYVLNGNGPHAVHIISPAVFIAHPKEIELYSLPLTAEMTN